MSSTNYISAIRDNTGMSPTRDTKPNAGNAGLPTSPPPPQLDYPPLRVVRFSGQALTKGVETHVVVDRVTIRVYSVARPLPTASSTVTRSDWTWRSRRSASLDAEKRARNDELWRYAKICRVANVMRPKMENLEGRRRQTSVRRS